MSSGDNIFREMRKNCIYCGSKNVFPVDNVKGVIVCLDCYKCVSNQGNYVSLIYITDRVKDVSCVRDIFDQIYPDTEIHEVVGIYIVTKKLHEISHTLIAKILKADCVNTDRLSLTFNTITVSPKCVSLDQKLSNLGVISIRYADSSVSLSVIGNALDGESLLKLIGYLIVSGCREIKFS